MRFWLIALCFLIAGLMAFFFVTSEKAIPPVTRQNPTFEPDMVARGESLATIGNCDICHTSEAGPRLAGGRAIPTPFGAVYSTNITPDRDTGLGAWSEAAFQRAMHDGISRDGRHLYPAFPYDHFTIVTAADTHALFTYLESRPSVKAPAHENTLWPPLKIRRLVAVWN
jgi:mono/diheme cytochrome c family protein